MGAQAQAVTFAKDVAPIVQDKCGRCHHPGGMAPMSLLRYEDARPWARSMKQRVASREMPPWFVDKTIGNSAVTTGGLDDDKAEAGR